MHKYCSSEHSKLSASALTLRFQAFCSVVLLLSGCIRLVDDSERSCDHVTEGDLPSASSCASKYAEMLRCCMPYVWLLILLLELSREMALQPVQELRVDPSRNLQPSTFMMTAHAELSCEITNLFSMASAALRTQPFVVSEKRGTTPRAFSYASRPLISRPSVPQVGQGATLSPKHLLLQARPSYSRQVSKVAAVAGSDDIKEEANGLRRIGWISFWSQLALSIVSAIVLFFTATTASRGAFPKLPVFFNLAGVIAGFISTFLAYGKTRIARGVLIDGEKHSKSKVAAGLLGATRLNLAGMGATIVGLQSTVGGLVGKSLTSSSTGPYNAAAASNSPAALDVFAVQASTNTILLHFIALLFSNWALRVLNKDAQSPAPA